jgi:benzoyl-CoA reductase/2-hydroxyglutaryl-CoA dehydratase subunit BcrC/BadD/HgdB
MAKKKARRIIDDLLNKYYENIFEAKSQGELIGWCDVSFPQAIPDAFGLITVCPENYSCVVAAQGNGKELCEKAEAKGYSNGICSCARINLGSAYDDEESPFPLAKPDYILCCSSMCFQRLKWYRNVALECDIPIFVLDIPFASESEQQKENLEYARTQVATIIDGLAAYTGRTFNQDIFEKSIEIMMDVDSTWHRILEYAYQKPSPMNGFEWFFNIGALICLRTKQETLDAFLLLEHEIKENVSIQKSTYASEEKVRIFFEGIPCFPYLTNMMVVMARYNMNVVASSYATFLGGNLLSAETNNLVDKLLLSYMELPNTMGFEQAYKQRKEVLEKAQCDGILVHTSKSCKMWSGFLNELMRKLSRDLEIPVVFFDGDQADPREFAQAQFETRIQGFAESLE